MHDISAEAPFVAPSSCIRIPVLPIAPWHFEILSCLRRHQLDYGFERHWTTWCLQTLDSNTYVWRFSTSSVYPDFSLRFSSSAALQSTTSATGISYPRISVVVDDPSYP